MAAQELQDAYNLIKSGDKDSAREMLKTYIKDHPKDANGWWLMSNAVTNPDQRRQSLEKVLTLDPSFEPAQKALAKMDGAPVADVEYPHSSSPQAAPRPSIGGGQLMFDYPLQLRFRIIALAPQIFITDASGNSVLFVRQKILNLREDVRIFRDESKTEELYRINADRIIDIGARYRFTDSKTERPLGSIKQRGLKTIWRAHYDIETPNGDSSHSLTEDNPWVKVGDALLSEIPFVGFFTGFLLHPAYTVHDNAGLPVMQLTKEPAFFESKYRIDNLEPSISQEEEQRILLSLMMMVQLNRARG